MCEMLLRAGGGCGTIRRVDNPTQIGLNTKVESLRM